MYTQEQITALRAAIATGATVVEYGDKRVEYRSLAEMRSILAEMEAELAGQKQNARTKFAYFNSGVNQDTTTEENRKNW
jgi:uncharacterized protein YdbL (DUF1318 family)